LSAALQSCDWPAPAKLNLFLHIVGRRPDGYHLLQTVFQFLDHGDRLDFTVTDDAALGLEPALPGVPGDRNLALRAARLLQAEAGGRRGVHIRLHKRLPLGGGLGGGSSDAATTLVALNRLWGLDLPPERLAALGLTLGADVPVFVHGHAAWAEGVGERLTAVTLPEPWYLVVMPAATVPTAAVFADPELTRDSRPITIRDFLSGQGRNDCEAVVRHSYPEIAAALRWLGQYGEARMTGTGSCVFAAFPDAPSAGAALAAVRAPWRGFVARGRNRSPLHTRLLQASHREDGRPAA
jgi:4-diphosphocytidyl-2-C-methyl-D-erythritol kinase